MPIHDQGYRRYEGRRRPHGSAWWVIGRHEMVQALRQKRLIALLLVSWLQFVGRVFQIYIGVNFTQASSIAAGAQTFRSFLEGQSVFVFLVIVLTAGAIADDRRANALQVYLSKPLTRTEYIVGKLITPFALVLFVTLAPALLLLLVQVAFSGSLTFLANNLYLIPAIVLYSLIEALLASFLMLALSALSKSRRFAALTIAGAFFFTMAMQQALRMITGSRYWAVLSPRDLLASIGDAAFRSPGEPPLPPGIALVAIAALIAVSVLVLERRVRGVEVVK